jgi:microcystin-dependent protein
MDGFTGEIRTFGGNYAPQNWHLCDGTVLNISDYSPLYSLIGVTYGGDGATTFALPDLRGRIPICRGQGTGLTNRVIGEKGGNEICTITTDQLPNHTHPAFASKAAGTASNPQGNMWASPVTTTGTAINEYITYSSTYKNGLMDPAAIGSTGGGNVHNNVMPSFPLTFIICLNGIYPQRP